MYSANVPGYLCERETPARDGLFLKLPRLHQPLSQIASETGTPTNFSHFYGQRVSGFVVPPKTGDYVFYLASDDESELFLSSDESEENYKRIARVKREAKVARLSEARVENLTARRAELLRNGYFGTLKT